MAALSRGSELPLWSDHLSFLRRHGRGIGVLMILGVLTGLGWALTQPGAYSSTASVSLTPVPKYVLPTGTGLAAPEVSIDTDAQLLASPEVLRAVAGALGTDADGAKQSLSVTASPNSHVLHVTVTAPSPPAAAAAADAAAAALVRVRRKTLGALRLDQLRLLRLWIDGQDALLAKEQDRRLVIPAVDEQFAQILELRTGLQELEQARLIPAEVVDPALPAVRADYANREVPVISGAMLGLLAACLLGGHLDRRRLHASPPTGPLRHPRSTGYLPAALSRQGEAHHAL